MLLNNQWITEEIKEEIKKYLQKNDSETQQSKNYGMQKSSSKREVYSNKILPQEMRKLSNKQPFLTPKATRERRTIKTQR